MSDDGGKYQLFFINSFFNPPPPPAPDPCGYTFFILKDRALSTWIVPDILNFIERIDRFHFSRVGKQ